MKRVRSEFHLEMVDLFSYPRSPGYKEATTSRDAALAAAPSAAFLRDQAYEAIAAAGAAGLTADEAAARIGRSVLSVRPRVTELAALGRIKPTGERRRNGSRLSAKVWRPA